ncbi:fimbrial protein [Salmonella enterica subsp. salamae]|nr:fimbrial protein [Salmonella enterica]EBW4678230.1 fimbrial protein [Salmonella enterica subsp. salamae serovar Sofia]ECE5744116.1 fimbrial protein [Salmonella enterica subsp. salamae]ECJ2537345.1 fimbrial protein [Salmonella enterica subsp. salamae serovar Sofia]EED7471698.1 fimbrial protein [Salmonella enterica subsp. salamae]
MKFTPVLLALSVSVALFSGTASAITETKSVQMKFTSTVVTGTCTAQLVNSAGAAASEIPFGDVFRSDLTRKSRVEPLKIKFSNCSGVATAKVFAQPGAGNNCSGGESNDASFSGGLNSGVGFEVWSGSVDTGVLLNCGSAGNPATTQDVTIANGTGELSMNSRIVLASGKTADQVALGTVSAPVTFVVTYP